MNRRSIRIKITDKGVEMDYNGFVGNDCQIAHTNILKRLKAKGLDINIASTVSTPKTAEAQDNEREREAL